EAGEVAALAQLGDAQRHGAGPRLPGAIAVAVALYQAGRALLAMAGARQRADLDLHQPLGGKRDHLAQKIGVGCLLHERTQVHHLIGHRRLPGSRVGASNPTLTRKSSVTAASPLPRYGAFGERARSRPLLRPATPPPGARPMQSAGSGLTMLQLEPKLTGEWRLSLIATLS